MGVFKNRRYNNIRNDREYQRWLGEYFILIQEESGNARRIEQIYAMYNSGIEPKSAMDMYKNLTQKGKGNKDE